MNDLNHPPTRVPARFVEESFSPVNPPPSPAPATAEIKLVKFEARGGGYFAVMSDGSAVQVCGIKQIRYFDNNNGGAQASVNVLTPMGIS